MLALAFVLDAEDLVDEVFLRTYTVGYQTFIAYVRGNTDAYRRIRLGRPCSLTCPLRSLSTSPAEWVDRAR
jgi:hypothetical protein